MPRTSGRMSKAPSEGRTRECLRSTFNRIWMGLSFTPTTEAATSGGFSLCLIPYYSIEERHELFLFRHELSVPHPTPIRGLNTRSVVPCGDMRPCDRTVL